ncbi:MAG: MBL fold metallo-hydrolase [Spirochaetota bacterium]|nr:MBL fold metallo-hydrolase [Spirochaetota bacterium]
MIIEQILVTGMLVFCYLIGEEDSREGVLIDPAGDFHKIFEKVNEHRINVKWIINTHGHFDHISGNSYVVDKTNAGLLIHRFDERKLRSRINRLLSRMMGGMTSPDPVKYLDDGDEIEIGDIKLKVIHTPGHTKGSICIYLNGHIFTGDTLFTEGLGRTDLLGANHNEIILSIKKRILTLPDETIIWPGHHYGISATSTVKEQKMIYL